jgi:hypothetical protein
MSEARIVKGEQEAPSSLSKGESFPDMHWETLKSWTAQKLAKELREKFGVVRAAGAVNRSALMHEFVRQYSMVNPIQGLPQEMREVADIPGEGVEPVAQANVRNPLNPYPGKEPGTEVYLDMVIHPVANESRYQMFANQSANMEYLVERGKRIRLPKLLVKTAIDDAIEEVGEAIKKGDREGEPIFRAIPRFSYTIYGEVDVPIQQKWRLKPEKILGKQASKAERGE